MKIKKDDEVIVLTGKYKGKTGTVTQSIPKEGKVVVSGVNVVKRHTKPGMGGPGGITEKELPIDVSNVAFYDADYVTSTTTISGAGTQAAQRSVRLCK
jgi:large subunit ribosomal protein L24